VSLECSLTQQEDVIFIEDSLLIKTAFINFKKKGFPLPKEANLTQKHLATRSHLHKKCYNDIKKTNDYGKS